jgi:hypothetical protein
LDATYGPGGTDAYQGIATNFPVAINVSTYPSLELDIANEGLFDEYSQIQAIQLNLQLPVAGLPTYEMGTLGSISLNATQNPDGTWTHYVIPMSDWAGYNLTGLTAFAINIYDGDTTTNTELDPAFSNIKFTGAPAWAPVFSGLTSPTIGTNSTSVTLTGTVSATVAGTNLYLANNTVVTVTINGIAQQTTIDDATGNFSINYNTTGLPADVYPVTYKAASDLVALVGATNSSTSLTVIAISVPIINPPYLEGTNLVISVNTQSGHTYYLLSTTNLAPPVVWSTNITTAGTGGTITNSVGISPGQPDEFFKFEVH